jgi:hypothetical protein
VIEIVIIGVNDDITAVNDTDAVNEDATITRSTSSAQELDHDDTDTDGDDASGSFHYNCNSHRKRVWKRHRLVQSAQR